MSMAPPGSGPNLRAIGFGRSDCGLVRVTNEDALFVSDEAQVYAVADGMGGLPYGEKARACAVSALEHRVEMLIDGRLDVGSLIREINRAVWQMGRLLSPQLGVGTTLTVLVNRGSYCEVAHVGDSAAYWISAGKISCLTPEQAEKVAFGDSPGGEAASPLFRTELSEYVGRTERIQPVVFCFRPKAGDRVLITSDGLTAALELDDLLKVCEIHSDTKRLADALVKIASIRGGSDNVTTITVDFILEEEAANS